MADFMTTEREMYVKLKSKNPFRCNYAYIDDAEEVGRVMKLKGLAGKILHVMRLDGKSRFVIVIINFKKKDKDKFLDAMNDIKRNAVLFGWDKDENYDMILDDMRAAGGLS